VAFLAQVRNLCLRHTQKFSVDIIVVFSQAAGSAADTAGRFGHFPQHAGIAVCATFTVRDRLKEATDLQVRVSIGFRLGEHHAGGHAMRLQMLHGDAGILSSGPGGEVAIQFVLML